SSVHRPAILAPARCTTASAPAASGPTVAAATSHRADCAAAPRLRSVLPSRTNLQTVCRSSASARTSAVPTSPVEPVTRIFILASWNSRFFRLAGCEPAIAPYGTARAPSSLSPWESLRENPVEAAPDLPPAHTAFERGTLMLANHHARQSPLLRAT